MRILNLQIEMADKYNKRISKSNTLRSNKSNESSDQQQEFKQEVT